MPAPTQLIFIISQPRSGSTLTQKLLSNNSKTDTVSEPWILLPYLSVFRPDLIKASYNSQVAKDGIQDYLKKQKLESVYEGNLRNFLLSLYPVKDPSHFFIDKTPRYYEILDEIYQMFPEAKYLILKRSPFASLYSMLETWSGFKTDSRSLSTFYRDFLEAPKKIQDFANQHGKKPNVHEVKYENIVRGPLTYVKQIYDWIGIPFTEEVLEISKNDKVRGIYGDDVYKKNPVSKIAPDKNADWEEKIRKDKNTERFFADYAEYLGDGFVSQYGYETMKNKNRGGLKFSRSDFEKLLQFVESEKIAL